MADLALTQSQARKFLLAWQNLWPPRSLHGKQGALDFIRKVGCIQFDPLDITGKNAELVLQSRVADFTPAMLDELLYKDRMLLDGFDKMMAIYSVEDWPYFRRRRESARNELRSQESVGTVAPHIRKAIEERGPLSSIDLDHNEKVGWWWGPTSLSRAALESMYLTGELVIHHKVHTRKVYDLAERHIPPALFRAPEPNPTDDQYHDWYVLRRLGSAGMLWDRSGQTWLTAVNSPRRIKVIQRLIERGTILALQVEGIEVLFYMRSEDKAFLDDILASPEPPTQAVFIAPLDNLMWERSLIASLFGFDYRWEVYTPPKKRKYGYYVLPVLYGDRFVARFEPVREKKTGTLAIKNWWWEPDITPAEDMLAALEDCFTHFCTFLGVKRVQMDGYASEPTDLAWLTRQLASKQ